MLDGQGTLCSTTHFPFCAFFHGTASNTHTAGSVCVWEGEGKSVVTVLVEGHHCWVAAKVVGMRYYNTAFWPTEPFSAFVVTNELF